MPIELPRGLPFAVDTWSPASALKRHRFLTHAHRDHLAGIINFTAAVYASRLTALIARHIFPQFGRDAFVEMDLGAPVLVSDPDGDFTVTAFDANHCPGAVMFLFEGAFGSVLHTGDCRLTPDCLQGLPLGHIAAGGGSGARQAPCCVDYLFLDCTFARCSLQFPPKEDAIRQVINCIWKNPNAPAVYLVSDMLGQEEILIEVSRVFGSKIYVDKDKNSECYHTLSHVAPEILTDDLCSRFQVVGFPRLPERAAAMIALARAKQQPEPLIIRPSSQWYANYAPPEGRLEQKLTLMEPMRDEFGVWHVCFSMHSSCQELDQALRFLKPKWVVSTTPPCLALDLDYVKKHCFLSRLGPDDPLWKLLRLSDGKPVVTSSPDAAPSVEDVRKNEEEATCLAEEPSSCTDRIQAQDEEVALGCLEIRVEQPVTLFGRARFELPQDYQLWKDEHESVDQVIEDVKSEAQEQQNSATESKSSKDVESDMSAGVIDLSEAAPPKQQDSAAESKSWKHCKSDDDIQVIDIEEAKAKFHGSSTDPELLKYEKCDEGVKGIGDGGFKAQEQNLAVRTELWEIYKPREGVQLIEVHKSKIEATEQLPAAADYPVSRNPGKCHKEAPDTCSKCEGPDKENCDPSHAAGSSRGLSANLRKLYRSMNVPVPRPLPSLVELMGASKRARVAQL